MDKTKNTLMTLGILVFVIVLFLNGCATDYQTVAAYQRAQSSYDQAKATPGISENASVAMYDASKYLKRAKKAEDEEEITRLSNLAEKQVNYAVAVADQKMAEKKIEALELEKQKIRLESRQREIETARKQVEEAQAKTLIMKQEAEQARLEAEAKAMEAKEALQKAEESRKKAEELTRQIEELQALKTERGIVLTLGDVLFSSGKADLTSGAGRTLDKLANFLRKNKERDLVIEGHTDNVGSDSFNLNLSERRAESVRSALLARGVEYSRITTKGYGEVYPVADNTSATGRQQNRRVEIIILNEGAGADSIRRN